MDLEELRKLDLEKLNAHAEELRRKLFEANYALSMGQSKASHEAKKLKVELAQTNTVITEKKNVKQ